LIGLLAGGDENLFAEFERLNAYIHIDSYINAYLIHPLFLEFLRNKQELLSEDQKRETYTIAANWCNKNGFRIDALSYFEKIGDYQSIVHLFFELPTQLPAEMARYAASIFDRAPPEDFDKVKFLAEIHLRTYIHMNLFQEALELVKRYEAKFLALPEDDIDGKRILARLYICWAYLRIMVGSTEDVYDFDTYMGKACKLLSTSIDPGTLTYHCPGAWIICVGTSRKGAPEDFIASLERAQVHILPSFIRGFMAGEAELAQGELEFYRGEADAAALNVSFALKKAREHKQLGIIHRALYCSLRIAVLKGNSALAEQMLKETKDQLNETDYLSRFVDYDISLSWYYCFLGLPEKAVDWAKEDFLIFNHPGFVENFMNQIKVRYCYATRKFQPLLVFIDEMRRRNSYLFERIELLAIEACIYYKMNDKKKAFSIFMEAYETALPNGILMPFIELGKDMRTLTASALKESECKIPGEWLELVYRKATSYSKRQAHISIEYKKANDIEEDFVLSPREMQILSDLSHGLTRAEIAVNRDLSVNTVKTIINMIYSKAGATNLPDLIRIALERKII
jgi:LuxR family transcriptional regulator, maltose regulon positive regulatory protein